MDIDAVRSHTKEETLSALWDKDDKKSYDNAKRIIAESAACDSYYSYFDDFVEMTYAESSFIRARGFLLCCSQARWDTEGKFEKAFKALSALLHDAKPTAVRQSLAALHEVIIFLPEMREAIEKELDTIELSKYKDSMTPLLKKDIESLREELRAHGAVFS